MDAAGDRAPDRFACSLNVYPPRKPTRGASRRLPQGLAGILTVRDEGNLSLLKLEQLRLH
jgi:hypothetical protein